MASAGLWFGAQHIHTDTLSTFEIIPWQQNPKVEKYKRPKLGGGQAYDRSIDYAAVVA